MPDLFTWPRALVPARSFSIDPKVNAVRTTMDSGRVRQRLRQTKVVRSIGIEWELSDLEFGYFQSIQKYLLSNGVDRFVMSLPMGDNGFKCYEVRFVATKSYPAKYNDVMFWKISAQLDLEEPTEPYDECCITLLTKLNFDLEGFEVLVARAASLYNTLYS